MGSPRSTRRDIPFRAPSCFMIRFRIRRAMAGPLDAACVDLVQSRDKKCATRANASVAAKSCSVRMGASGPPSSWGTPFLFRPLFVRRPISTSVLGFLSLISSWWQLFSPPFSSIFHSGLSNTHVASLSEEGWEPSNSLFASEMGGRDGAHARTFKMAVNAPPLVVWLGCRLSEFECVVVVVVVVTQRVERTLRWEIIMAKSHAALAVLPECCRSCSGSCSGSCGFVPEIPSRTVPHRYRQSSVSMR
mmetsp:Transcript_23344/g.42129  ORF Transcript_23344/g.42129 Transcript_23344/m.42129 type:complete len:247 (+) Transcript_23344:958-1698(+)